MDFIPERLEFYLKKYYLTNYPYNLMLKWLSYGKGFLKRI